MVVADKADPGDLSNNWQKSSNLQDDASSKLFKDFLTIVRDNSSSKGSTLTSEEDDDEDKLNAWMSSETLYAQNQTGPINTPEQSVADLEKLVRTSSDPEVHEKLLSATGMQRRTNILKKHGDTLAAGDLSKVDPQALERLTVDLTKLAMLSWSNQHSPFLPSGRPVEGTWDKQTEAISKEFKQFANNPVFIQALQQAQHRAFLQTHELQGRSEQEVGNFCARGPGNEKRSQQRLDAVKKIEKLSKDSGYNGFSNLLRFLDAADISEGLRESTDPKETLDYLTRLADKEKGGNKDAHELNEWLKTKVGKNAFEQVLKDLAKGDPLNPQHDKLAAQDAQKYLTAIVKGADNPFTIKLDEYRLGAIGQNLGPKPSLEQLSNAHKRLQREAKSGNKGAPDQLTKLDVTIALKKISSPDTFNEGKEMLLGLANKENQLARQAAIELLLSDHKNGLKKFDEITNTDRSSKTIPDLSNLSPEEKMELKRAIVDQIKKQVEGGGGLTATESAGLGLAIVAAREGNEPELAGKIGTVFDGIFERELPDKIDPKEREKQVLLSAKQTEEVLDGLYQAIQKTGYKERSSELHLAYQFSKGARSKHNIFIPDSRSKVNDVGNRFSEQVRNLMDLAKTGHPTALQVVAALSAGVGDGNEKANKPVFDSSTNTYKNGDLSSRSGKFLEDLASFSPDMRQKILKVLTGNQQTQLIADKGVRCQTLGKIAAQNIDDVPESVRKTLRDKLPINPSGATKGLMELAPILESDDVMEMAHRASKDLVNELKTSANSLNPEAGRLLAKELVKVMSSATSSPTTRENAVRALAELAPYHGGAEVVEALTAFGGKEGLSRLSWSIKGEMELRSEEDRTEEARKLQALSGDVLLSIAQWGNDSFERALAFSRFADKSWMPIDQIWTEQIKSILKNNPDSPTIQQLAPKIVSGIERKTPTSMQPVSEKSDYETRYDTTTNSYEHYLRYDTYDSGTGKGGGKEEGTKDDRGKGKGRDNDDRDRAQAKVEGSDKCKTSTLPKPAPTKEQIVELAAIFKERGVDLPDEYLKIVTEKAAKNYGYDKVKAVARQLALFNSLPSDVRQKLTGNLNNLQEGTELSLIDCKLTVEVFNNLSPETRKSLTGSGDKSSKKNFQALSGSIDAKTFNDLPDEVRKQITSTSEALDTGIVLSQLANGEISNKHLPSNILIDDFTLKQKLILLENINVEHLTKLREELKQTKDDKDALFKQLKSQSNKGLWFWEKFASSITYGDLVLGFGFPMPTHVSDKVNPEHGLLGKPLSESQNKFIATQRQLLRSVSDKETAVKDKLNVIGKTESQTLLLSLALANSEYASLVADGKTDQADEFAMQMLKQFGRAALLAPDLKRDINQEGSNPFSRLSAKGKADSRELKLLETLDSKGFENGLKLLTSLSDSKGIKKLDQPFLIGEGLLGVDSNQSVRKLSEISVELSDDMQLLSTLVGTAQGGGDKFEDYIKHAKERGKRLQETLKKVTPGDIKGARDAKKAIDEAIKNSANPQVKMELENRSRSIEGLLSLLDPKYAPPVGQTLEKLKLERFVDQKNSQFWDSDYRVPKALARLQEINAGNQRHRIDRMLETLDTVSFNNKSDFATWVKTDGVVILASTAAAIAATALVIASGGTALPVIMAAVAAGMIASEGTIELQYKSGLRDHGSRIGSYARSEKQLQADGSYKEMELFSDVVLPYASEFAIGVGTAWLAGAAGEKIGSALTKMAAPLRNAFIAENKAVMTQLAKNATQLEKHADPFMKRLATAALQEAKVQPIMAVAAVGMEQTVHDSAKSLGLHLYEQHALTSFFVQMSLSAAHRAMQPKNPKTRPSSLSMEYKPDPKAEKTYVSHKRKMGSEFTPIENGFREVTREGLVIDWVKETNVPTKVKEPAGQNNAPLKSPIAEPMPVLEPKTTHPPTKEIPPETNDLRGRQILRKPFEPFVDALGRPDLAAAVELQLDICSLELKIQDAQQLARAQGKSAEFKDNPDVRALAKEQDQLQRALNSLKLNTKAMNAVNQIASNKAMIELYILKNNYTPGPNDTRILNIEKINELTSTVCSSDAVSLQKLSFAYSTETFAPGEYVVHRPDGNGTIKLVVEKGAPVSKQLVDEALKASGLDGQDLGQIRIRRKDPAGNIAHCDGFEIMLTSATANVEHAFFHEGGHLYEGKNVQNDPTLDAKVVDIWKKLFVGDQITLTELQQVATGDDWVRQVLNDSNHPHHKIITELGSVAKLNSGDVTAHRELLVELLGNPRDHFSPKTQREQAMYYGCCGEMFAEMYALYKYKSIMQGQGKSPSFTEMAKRTELHGHDRARLLRCMEPMYNALEKFVFPKQQLLDDITEKFRSTHANNQRKSLTEAAKVSGTQSPEYDTNRPEFRKKMQEIKAQNEIEISNLVIDELISKAKSKFPNHEQYHDFLDKHMRKLKDDGYKPGADSELLSLPEGDRMIMNLLSHQQMYKTLKSEALAHNNSRLSGLEKCLAGKSTESIVIGNHLIPMGTNHLIVGQDYLNTLNKAAQGSASPDLSNVSKKHVQIGRDVKGIFVMDLSTENGTYLNGERRIEPLKKNYLMPDDFITIGGTTENGGIAIGLSGARKRR
ncbi:MAG: FHA domain-containing protein [Candidatus Obscuribacterales bacterium]|nr:FHA domain-containing protein [Candidatus Obscuribacterales bacterium]